MSTREMHYQYVIVGGGLQGCLLWLALRHHQPDATILLIEKQAHLGGNHTWSFHANDAAVDRFPWRGALRTTRWPAYEVKFPGFHSRLDLTYQSIRSADLASDLERTLPSNESRLRWILDATVSALSGVHVELASGEFISADVVLDCRGPGQFPREHCGFQKFVGCELELDEDCPSSIPTLIDANCEQFDGFRFFYVLPFSPRRVLVEETFFSDGAQLDPARARERVNDYAERWGAGSFRVVREESGCLPMPFGFRSPGVFDRTDNRQALVGGYAGGWFHAATGYSVPVAVRFADAIGRVSPADAHHAAAELRAALRFPFQASRFLNRLLFRLMRPSERWRILRRFYRKLPDPAINRFYAHEFTPWDLSRLVVGAPPRGLTPLRYMMSYGGA